MLLLTLLLFGDFTYTPPAGKWLDYSRSMPLSANRHLIVEHSGPVNDHSTAGSQKVLDQSGKFLYELNSAQGAWFVYNGVVGSEDTFLYQKHPSRTDRRNPFHLWHPQFGDRVIKVNGKDLAQDRRVEFVLLLNQGRRIAVLSQSYDPTNDSSPFHLEVVDLKGSIQDVISAPELPFDAYVDSKIISPLSQVVDQFAYFHDGASKLILMLDISQFGADPHVQEIETALTPLFFKVNAGYFSYLTMWDGSPAQALEGIHDEFPLFILAESDKERPGYQELHDFMRAFADQGIFRENDFLYAKCKDRFYVYDLAQNILSVYRDSTWDSENGTIGGYWTPVNAESDFIVSNSTYRVQAKTAPLSRFKKARPELLKTVNVNLFKKTIL